MVNRMRATRAHRDNRRSHHALDAVRTTKCPNCKSTQLMHTACKICGQYRGRIVIDMKAKLDKKTNKKKK